MEDVSWATHKIPVIQITAVDGESWYLLLDEGDKGLEANGKQQGTERVALLEPRLTADDGVAIEEEGATRIGPLNKS